MSHWRKMLDPKEMLHASDLDGRDVTITIEKVTAGIIDDKARNQRYKKPVISILGKPDKKLALNVTNCKTIAAMYGSETDGWAGKMITLFPTTTQFGPDTVECIRVRPTIPRVAPKADRDHEAQAKMLRADAAGIEAARRAMLTPRERHAEDQEMGLEPYDYDDTHGAK